MSTGDPKFTCMHCGHAEHYQFMICPKCGCEQIADDSIRVLYRCESPSMEYYRNEIASLKSRISELEAENKRLSREMQARDKVLLYYDEGCLGACDRCANDKGAAVECTGGCIQGMIEFARKEIGG